MLHLHHCFIYMEITIEYNDKQDIFTNFESESIIPSIKKYLFHQRMVDFLNKLEISDQQYKTNGTVRDDNYKGNFLFPRRTLCHL